MEASRGPGAHQAEAYAFGEAGARRTQSADPQGNANHLFANNVRFLSMAAIVAVHSIEYNLDKLPYHSSLCYVEQPFKFGTIAFFLVSGFLFGDRIDQYNSLQYFGRRLRNVFLPWLSWFLLLRIGADLIHGRLSRPDFGVELDLSKKLLFNSSFWFVPNLLFALALLLVFRHVLRDFRIGILFLLGSLFYSANIYGHWITTSHTRAVFGFVFYLWLGAWSSWHFSAIEKWLARIPTLFMLALVGITLCLSLGESCLLFKLGSTDPMNSLRLSNQLFSIAAVMAIVKLKKPVSPRFVDVRRQTFGIYLTHPLILPLISVLLTPVVQILSSSAMGSTAAQLEVIALTFILGYTGCLFVVWILLAIPGLRWTVGPATTSRGQRTGTPLSLHAMNQ